MKYFCESCWLKEWRHAQQQLKVLSVQIARQQKTVDAAYARFWMSHQEQLVRDEHTALTSTERVQAEFPDYERRIQASGLKSELHDSQLIGY